jgi:uncharacterized protein YjdB
VPARIEVGPKNANVGVGQTIQLSLTVYDQFGRVMSAPSASWTSGDPAIASVNGSGLVTGRKKGHVGITASVLGLVGGTSVRVK